MASAGSAGIQGVGGAAEYLSQRGTTSSTDWAGAAMLGLLIAGIFVPALLLRRRSFATYLLVAAIGGAVFVIGGWVHVLSGLIYDESILAIFAYTLYAPVWIPVVAVLMWATSRLVYRRRPGQLRS
jgi:hypothetical protein